MKKLKFIVAAVGALLWFTAAVPVYAQDPPDEDPPAQTTSGVWGACEGDNSTRPVCADKSEADGVVKKNYQPIFICHWRPVGYYDCVERP